VPDRRTGTLTQLLVECAPSAPPESVRRVVEGIDQRVVRHAAYSGWQEDADALKQVKNFMEQRYERERSLFSFLPPKRPGCSLVITGAEGCGKTKLLCAAVAEVSRPLVETDSSMGSMTSGDHGEPTPVIIFRSVGSSHSLRTGRDLMRSVCLQLTSVVQSTGPVPTNYTELTVRLGMLLAEVGESRRVILILDGLDQLVRCARLPCLQ